MPDIVSVPNTRLLLVSSIFYLNFVDFKAAFDSIWGMALWKMWSIVVDPKITSLIESMCDNVECAVVINGQLNE